MKSKLLVLVSLLFSLSVTTAAHAEKIAVLGVQEALLASDAAKDFRKDLQAELEKDEQLVLELEKQVKAVREKIVKNKDLASEDELKRLRIQHQKVFAEFQRNGQALQQKRLQKEQEFIQQMRPVLDKVIRGLIEKRDYDLVVARQATLFAKKDLDITSEVVKLLNKQ